MLAAWESLFGKDQAPACICENATDAQIDRDNALWNNAWTLAKLNKFWIQQPKQTMSDFFARDDVKALQDIQKRNSPNSKQWKTAERNIRALASEIGAENFFA